MSNLHRAFERSPQNWAHNEDHQLQGCPDFVSLQVLRSQAARLTHPSLRCRSQKGHDIGFLVMVGILL